MARFGGPGDPLLVANPRASRLQDADRRDRVLDDVRRAVEAATGRAPRIVVGEDLTVAEAALDEAAADGATMVAVIGGDGTVRDAATRLTGTGIPLAIVPAGTANLFAATAGVPMRIAHAIDLIADGRTADLDLGRVRWGALDEEGNVIGPDRLPGERIFVVAAGMGFDAALMAATTGAHKRRFGRYGYFVAGLGQLRRLRGFDCVVRLDGEPHELRALQVLAANGGELIPGIVRPRRRINPHDGLLDVFVVLGDGLVAGTAGALEAIGRRDLGRSRSGRSLRARVRTVRVDASSPQPVEVDGDAVGQGWFEAEALARSIRVIVP